MRKPLVLGLAILCVAVPAWTTKKKAEVDSKRFQEKLSKDEQVLHTHPLHRFDIAWPRTKRKPIRRQTIRHPRWSARSRRAGSRFRTIP